MRMYWGWMRQAAAARERGDYRLAMFLIGQARVERLTH